jgi:hypothetical protein
MNVFMIHTMTGSKIQNMHEYTIEKKKKRKAKYKHLSLLFFFKFMY